MIRASTLFLLSLFAFFLHSASARAQGGQDSTINQPNWSMQFDLFQWLFEQRGLTIRSNLKTATKTPKESVIVIVGSVEKLPRSQWRLLQEFVADGGSLFIAADEIKDGFGFGTIHAGPVSTKVTSDQYSGFSDCLRIRDILPVHTMMHEVGEIVVNRTGWIEQSHNGLGMNEAASLAWQPLVLLPQNCTPASSRTQPILSLGTHPVSSDGHALLLADPSVISNSMIWIADNGRLAIQIADTLCEGDRTQLLFMVDGNPMKSAADTMKALASKLSKDSNSDFNRSTSLDPNLLNDEDVPLPMPEMQTLLSLANAALEDLSQTGVVNEVLRNQPRQFSESNYLRWIWGVTAIILGLWLLWKLMQRSKYIAPFLTARRMWSSHAMQLATMQTGHGNRLAAELLARDFCREWTGKESINDWRFYLDRLRSMKHVKMQRPDQQFLEIVLHNAIHGVSAAVTDATLEERAFKMKELLSRYPEHRQAIFSGLALKP